MLIFILVILYLYLIAAKPVSARQVRSKLLSEDRDPDDSSSSSDDNLLYCCIMFVAINSLSLLTRLNTTYFEYIVRKKH